MDIQKKLKLFFWILVLGIWGAFAYAFLSKGKISKVIGIENPFKEISLKAIASELITAVEDVESSISPASVEVVEVVTEQPDETQPASPLEGEEIAEEVPPAYVADYVSVITEEILEPSEIPFLIAEYHTLSEREETSMQLKLKTKPIWKPAPQGYASKKIKGFSIYKEFPPILKKVLKMFTILRNNLMLDLVTFSPWLRDNKVLVYLFDKKETYHGFTKRPSWSQGTSNLLNRTVYLVNGLETLGILAHELTHIYFDSFFNKSVPSPLWLSEGMAVMMQAERSGQAPTWLKKNLLYIENGDGFKMKELMSFQNLKGVKAKDVRLWYAQSYSIVRFLTKIKSMDNFYQFCKNTRDGKNVSGSLYRSYGQPFNSVSALEAAWKYDVKTKRISNIWQ
ncbi:MAG TPA: hypothetical protein VMW66_04885 [Elusimicrobiales bacterium]|nr:hypothetical protein [Elusimicrobiales bacterium]